MHQKFDKVFDLVKQKVFYPYETLFNETLPSKKEFYSLLSGRGISDKKYQHVLKVSNESEMKTLKDYHDLYSKCNVLLLPDVFEKFANRCLDNYSLCPSHYLSALTLCWDTMLVWLKLS